MGRSRAEAIYVPSVSNPKYMSSEKTQYYKILLTVITVLTVLGVVIYRASVPDTLDTFTYGLDGTAIAFTHTDENEGEDLVIT